MSVSVNSPKTPVTAGSSGIAAATVPNVCKMPGPPAPFVPTPLPNIGKSDDSPDGYSKDVTIESNAVAIQGATFNSTGDSASKGTGGGLISNNTHGATKFIGPGSMDVKIEGKNVQLLGDPMLNNCGPGGNPPNAATLMGVIQQTGMITVVKSDKCPVCEGSHKEFKESDATKATIGFLARKFEAEVRAVDGQIKTMLGVVVCRCDKKYADQSGPTTVELCSAADQASLRHPSGVTLSCREGNDARTRLALSSQNAVMERLKQRMTAAGKGGVFKRARANAELFSKESKASKADPAKRAPTAYPPGNCAAQKAMLLLLDDGGLAATLTERWFASDGSPTDGAITYIDNTEGKAEKVSARFGHGKSVPPCKTCNTLVPLFLCDLGQASCEHKT